MIVYGAKISYFTGKFETYLRYKGIGYEYRPLDSRMYRVVPKHLGATQYPSVELDDGRWMSDTTPMIAWLEERHPEPAVIPRDPVQRFLSLLVEDYADEWLWRPAMHYRWSYAPDRYLAGTRLADEIVRIPGVPRALAAAVDREAPGQALRDRRRDRRAHPRPRRGRLPAAARLDAGEPHRAPVHARRAPDDRRHRPDGPLLAPLRPRPDAGAAPPGPGSRGLRVGGEDLERARRRGGRAAARRRDPGRLGPAPRARSARPTSRRSPRTPSPTRTARPSTTSRFRGRPTGRSRRAPTGPGACASSRPATRSCPPTRPPRCARSSSATAAGSRSGAPATSAATTTRAATAPFCKATRMVRD